jgi:hypothetical protein
MRRIILMLTVAALMVAMVAHSTPAFAQWDQGPPAEKRQTVPSESAQGFSTASDNSVLIEPVESGGVTFYKVNLAITFVLEESEQP